MPSRTPKLLLLGDPLSSELCAFAATRNRSRLLPPLTCWLLVGNEGIYHVHSRLTTRKFTWLGQAGTAGSPPAPTGPARQAGEESAQVAPQRESRTTVGVCVLRMIPSASTAKSSVCFTGCSSMASVLSFFNFDAFRFTWTRLDCDNSRVRHGFKVKDRSLCLHCLFLSRDAFCSSDT